MNNSSTGGFLKPNPQPPALTTVPPKLTLIQFIQTLLVGLSELSSDLVRSEWQLEPPKQPDATVNWLAFGIKDSSSLGYCARCSGRLHRWSSNKINRVYLSSINLFSCGPCSGIRSKIIFSSGFLLSTIGDSCPASSSAEDSLLLLSA